MYVLLVYYYKLFIYGQGIHPRGLGESLYILCCVIVHDKEKMFSSEIFHIFYVRYMAEYCYFHQIANDLRGSGRKDNSKCEYICNIYYIDIHLLNYLTKFLVGYLQTNVYRCFQYTAISIKVVPEQNGKAEYERERLLGIAKKLMNLLAIPNCLSRSYSTFPLCSGTTLI